MAIEQINSGSAPLKWSAVDDAFSIINDNFTTLVATIGEYGVTPIDFNTLNTSVSPAANGEYDLGTNARRWKDLYLSNSLQLGEAEITATGSIVQLPAGSKVGDLLLDESYFKTIAVSGQSNIVADTGTDTLTFANGTGIAVTTDANSDTLTISNAGVTGLVGTAGQIGVSAGTGNVTLTNLGVTSIANGPGISVSAATGGVTISNAGIISIVTDPGSGISLDTSVANTVRITNSAPNIVQNTFRNINVAGQNPVIADGATDTLTLIAGTGVTITTNENNDSVTISAQGASPAGVNCSPGADTVVYQSVSAGVKTIKLLVQYEGSEDGGDGNLHTHSCDMIVVKRNSPTGVVTVDATIYGSVYTSVAAIATFDAVWNLASSKIQVTARPVSLTNQGWVKVFATEITLAD